MFRIWWITWYGGPSCELYLGTGVPRSLETDYSYVDLLVWRFKFVNFVVAKRLSRITWYGGPSCELYLGGVKYIQGAPTFTLWRAHVHAGRVRTW